MSGLSGFALNYTAARRIPEALKSFQMRRTPTAQNDDFQRTRRCQRNANAVSDGIKAIRYFALPRHHAEDW
eukprot:1355523-Pyramimonas_sp.AAC.1